jgi:hypothetical protein
LRLQHRSKQSLPRRNALLGITFLVSIGKTRKSFTTKVLVSIRHEQEPEYEDIPLHVTIVTRRSQDERVTNFNNNYKTTLHLLGAGTPATTTQAKKRDGLIPRQTFWHAQWDSI